MTAGETETEPLTPEAVKPVPVQLVALVLLQVRVENWPVVMLVGLAVNVAVGTGAVEPTVTVTLLEAEPAEPVHVME